MSKFRAFLAIDVDDEIKNQIKIFQDKLKKLDNNLKYVNLDNLHLTLKFFGDIDVEKEKEIKIAISKIIHNQNPFSLKISSSGVFPNENHIKVLWVGVKENVSLIELYKNLDIEFNKLGFKKEKSYSPHLTIARIKKTNKRKEILDVLNEFKNHKFGDIKVNKIILKESKLTPKGSIYTDREIFEL
jgi:2'-5' RNA ligase